MAKAFTKAICDQQQSCFFRLPAELREDILELAFADDEDLHGFRGIV